MNTRLNPAARLHSIDLLRGLVMVIMTLDHTRDFFSNAHFSPTDLSQTWPALFFTRWITHFCAPVFVFLAGTSAYFWQQRRGGTEAALAGFLVKRGLLLIVLVASVEAWAWNFRYNFHHLDAGVLWALGWSMLSLALLSKLPMRVLVGFATVMLLFHNSVDHLKAADLGAFGPWWAILHTGEDINLLPGWVLNPYYPLIPWIGVMALGYSFGCLLIQPAWQSRQRLLGLGLLVSLAFIALRWLNLYGDPKPWQVYDDGVFTWLSFLNCHKYPPSLAYLLMTLGPALLVLGLFQASQPKFWPCLQLFGRTPLFFYVLHLYLLHGLAVLLAVLNDGPATILLGGGIWLTELPADYGYPLPWVYAIWLGVLMVLYPLCRGFETLKASKPEWRWLQYL